MNRTNVLHNYLIILKVAIPLYLITYIIRKPANGVALLKLWEVLLQDFVRQWYRVNSNTVYNSSYSVASFKIYTIIYNTSYLDWYRVATSFKFAHPVANHQFICFHCFSFSF